MTTEIRAHASGSWLVKEGSEDGFVARWTEFLGWTRDTIPGFVSASLIRDSEDPRHFVSVARWEDEGSRAAWKSNPAFAEKFMACRSLCEEFAGGDFDLAVHVS